MEAFRKLFFVAVLAGLGSGLFIAAVHAFGTVPIILKAETFEKAGAADGEAAAAGPAHEHGGQVATHEHEDAAWEPEDGLERTAFTLLADILTGIGFAMLLVSAYALRGKSIGWREGLYWGLAGFATFTLAPGLGLPPELPGTEAAPLLARQVWWITTAVATGSGLALVFLTKKGPWAIAGILLILAPHFVGAPQPAEHISLAPESLAHEFVVAAVATSLIFWLALGSLTGFLYRRFTSTA